MDLEQLMKIYSVAVDEIDAHFDDIGQHTAAREGALMFYDILKECCAMDYDDEQSEFIQ